MTIVNQDGQLIRPLTAGITPAAAVHADHAGPPLRKLPANVDRLIALEKDYVFFHHAILFTLGGLSFDPIALAYAEYNLPDTDRPLAIWFDKPILSGLGNAFDSVLYAAPKEHWPILEKQLDATSAMNTPRRLFWRSLRQRILSVDYLAQQKLPLLADWPTIVLNIVGLDSSVGCWHWAPPLPMYAGPISLTKSPPLSDTAIFVQTLFGDKLDE